MISKRIATLIGAVALSACSGPTALSPTPSPLPSASATSSLTSTPDPNGTCTGTATHAVTEGPYFKAGSPERTNLFEPGMKGIGLVLTGHVFDTTCHRLAEVVLDFWQADAGGAYDNSGYRLRGHEVSGADGSYRVQAIIPGLYPGRTEHIHVKLTPQGGPTLTTQLFFPGVPQNQADGIFDASLLVELSDAPYGGKAAMYDFVVAAH